MKKLIDFIVATSIFVLMMFFGTSDAYGDSKVNDIASEIYEAGIYDGQISISDETERIYVFMSISFVEKYRKELAQKYGYDKIVVIGDSAGSYSLPDTSKYSTVLKVFDVFIVAFFVVLFIVFMNIRKKLKKRKFQQMHFSIFLCIIFAGILSFNNVFYAAELSDSIEEVKAEYDVDGYPKGIVYINSIYSNNEGVEGENPSDYDIYVSTSYYNEIVDFLDKFSTEDLEKVTIRHYGADRESLIKQLNEAEQSGDNGKYEVTYEKATIDYWLKSALGHFFMASAVFVLLVMVVFIADRGEKENSKF